MPVGLFPLRPLPAVGLLQGEFLRAGLADLGGLGQQPLRRGAVLVGLPRRLRSDLRHLALRGGLQDGDLALRRVAHLLRLRAGVAVVGLALPLGVVDREVVVAPRVVAQLRRLDHGPLAHLLDVALVGRAGLVRVLLRLLLQTGGLLPRRGEDLIGLGLGLGAPGAGLVLGHAEDLLHPRTQAGQRRLLLLGDLRRLLVDLALQGPDALFGRSQLLVGLLRLRGQVPVARLVLREGAVELGGEIVDLVAVVSAHRDGELRTGVIKKLGHRIPSQLSFSVGPPTGRPAAGLPRLRPISGGSGGLRKPSKKGDRYGASCERAGIRRDRADVPRTNAPDRSVPRPAAPSGPSSTRVSRNCVSDTAARRVASSAAPIHESPVPIPQSIPAPM